MTRTIWILTLLACFLQACGSSASTPTSLPARPPTASPTLIPTPLPTETPPPTGAPQPVLSRVLVVSFDGLRPDAIAAGDMITVQELMQTGAYTLNAQTIIPSLTLPAHSSMLVGTCPAKHIVRWNEYVPENGYALGTDIFDLAHTAGWRTAFVTGKEKLRQVTEPASTDFFAFIDKTDKIEDKTSVLRLALDQVKEGFGLMFVHFAEGDIAGHESGWMSRIQLEVYNREDKGLGLILQALKDKGMYEDTLIIVTSDHGGHETTHGTNLAEDMTIPWIISGPGVLPGELTRPVHIMDTAATIAFALNLPLPPEWDGAPVYEAFGLPEGELRKSGCGY